MKLKKDMRIDISFCFDYIWINARQLLPTASRIAAAEHIAILRWRAIHVDVAIRIGIDLIEATAITFRVRWIEKLPAVIHDNPIKTYYVFTKINFTKTSWNFSCMHLIFSYYNHTLHFKGAYISFGAFMLCKFYWFFK